MHLVQLMWRSAFDPNSIISRYSRLAGREERLSQSKWNQSNLIESNAVLHMNVMTEFSSAQLKYGVWPGPKCRRWKRTVTCPSRLGTHKKEGPPRPWVTSLHLLLSTPKSQIPMMLAYSNKTLKLCLPGLSLGKWTSIMLMTSLRSSLSFQL